MLSPLHPLKGVGCRAPLTACKEGLSPSTAVCMCREVIQVQGCRLLLVQPCNKFRTAQLQSFHASLAARPIVTSRLSQSARTFFFPIFSSFWIEKKLLICFCGPCGTLNHTQSQASPMRPDVPRKAKLCRSCRTSAGSESSRSHCAMMDCAAYSILHRMLPCIISSDQHTTWVANPLHKDACTGATNDT